MVSASSLAFSRLCFLSTFCGLVTLGMAFLGSLHGEIDINPGVLPCN